MQSQATSVNTFARVGASVINRVDESLFTAHPTGGLSALLLEFRRSWLGELAQLTSLCEAQMGMSLEAVRRAAQFDERRHWSPAVFGPIAQLRIGVETTDVSSVMDAFAKIRNLEPCVAYDTRLRVGSLLTEEWEWDFVKLMRAYEPKGKQGESTLVLPILGDSLGAHRDAIQDALGLVRHADERIGNEFDSLVTRIKLFQGRVLRGETNTRVYGAVFLRIPPSAYHQVVYWIEHLVHEIAHLRLELLRVHDPLVLNDLRAVHAAPFRRDPRPMLGVFHATFVVARMMSVLRRLAATQSDPIYGERFESMRDKFDVGMRSLREEGQFTELGQAIVDSLAEVAHG